MVNDFFVTKLGMTQAWTKAGKRLAVTRCQAIPNVVVAAKTVPVVNRQSHAKQVVPTTILEIGYGKKKLKNVAKPLRTKLEKSGFSFGVAKVRGVRLPIEQVVGEGSRDAINAGDEVKIDQVLEVGDLIKVQGITKGRGFAGAIKRHGFHGGPATHGQSDRARAVGSIGAGTTPGRVWKGKKMPGHYGVETNTVFGLVVIHLDKETGEIWLSGPVPGHTKSYLKITKTGEKRTIKLDPTASGLPAEKPTTDSKEATAQDSKEATAQETDGKDQKVTKQKVVNQEKTKEEEVKA